MNSIKIDPCSACLDYYDITDINNINSCCYSTLGAFLNKNNINEIKNTPEAKNCANCIQESIKALGRDPCEFRPSPPAIISTSPHFLPYILKDEPDLDTALNKCLVMCKNSKECIKNCNIDALAVKYGQKSQVPSSSNNNINQQRQDLINLNQIQEPVRNTIVGDLPLKIEPFKMEPFRRPIIEKLVLEEKVQPKISFDDIKEKYIHKPMDKETDWNLLYFFIVFFVFLAFFLFITWLPDMVERKPEAVAKDKKVAEFFSRI